MFKKSGLLLFSVLFSCHVQAATLSEGGKYAVLPTPFVDAPTVQQFFSFNCTACYQFEVLGINERVRAALPAGVEPVKYHISTMGALGNELSQAWAVAVLLHVEAQITAPLFEAVQKQSRVRDKEDIRQIFAENGVKPEEYDAAWNSFAVKALVQRQKDAEEKYHVGSVPDVYINGKYRLLPSGMDQQSEEAFTADYSRTLLDLLPQS